MHRNLDGAAEWLEADGLGGFASGTVGLRRTRRYHALLLAAALPPTERFVLVNGLEAWVDAPGGSFPISTQLYAPDVLHPDGANRIESFASEPWPHWHFLLEDGTRIEQEVVALHGRAAVLVRFRLVSRRPGVALGVRPLLSGRDPHGLHRENGAFRFEARADGNAVRFQPYADVPAVRLQSNGRYGHAPEWYRSFLYSEERARGLDHLEDLASPGVLRFDLSGGDAWMVLEAEGVVGARGVPVLGTTEVEGLLESERERRRRFAAPLERAADAYVVRRGRGHTIVAGYPWFSDWGRDTFLAMRGICFATDRLDEAEGILREWAGAVSEGMLPNRFSDRGEAAEYNSVDASLWYVVAVHEWLQRKGAQGVAPAVRRQLEAAVDAILEGYTRGTRHGIRASADGLLAAGEPGVQLTWMDAKVGDWVVTPRIGKPVEVQALWLNALALAGERSKRWRDAFRLGKDSFAKRFWNAERECLYDVVDVDHVDGRVDGTLRPNQILAVGGLPLGLLDRRRARRLVDVVERELATPLGLRSLAPGEPGYAAHYEGGVRARDGAYHQGTVWPWLAGPFVEAWVRVRGETPEAIRDARERFLRPLMRHLGEAGLGHVSEIADAEPPWTPRGCPFQAWSVGELLRLDREVLVARAPSEAVAKPAERGASERSG